MTGGLPWLPSPSHVVPVHCGRGAGRFLMEIWSWRHWVASSLLWYPSRAELSSVGHPALVFLGYKVLLMQEVMRGIQGVKTQVEEA